MNVSGDVPSFRENPGPSSRGQTMSNEDAGTHLSGFLKTTGEFDDQTLGAVAAKSHDILKRLDGKESFAEVPKPRSKASAEGIKSDNSVTMRMTFRVPGFALRVPRLPGLGPMVPLVLFIARSQTIISNNRLTTSNKCFKHLLWRS